MATPIIPRSTPRRPSGNSGGPGAFPISFGIFQLARTHRTYAAQLLREFDLYPGQEILIMLLAERGAQSQAQLVQLLGLDHSTVAKSLGRMEKAGLIERSASQTDRRAMIVSLTRAGIRAQKNVRAAWDRLERASIAGLNDQQRVTLEHLMELVERSVATIARTP